MRLLIAVVKNGMAKVYHGPEPNSEKKRRNEEAQFLELKIASKSMNPNISKNLEYWKKLVEEKRFYGLLVSIDYDRAVTEYLPLKTKEDFESFANLGSEE